MLIERRADPCIDKQVNVSDAMGPMWADENAGPPIPSAWTNAREPVLRTCYDHAIPCHNSFTDAEDSHTVMPGTMRALTPRSSAIRSGIPTATAS